MELATNWNSFRIVEEHIIDRPSILYTFPRSRRNPPTLLYRCAMDDRKFALNPTTRPEDDNKAANSHPAVAGS